MQFWVWSKGFKKAFKQRKWKLQVKCTSKFKKTFSFVSCLRKSRPE